tara:strand:- start:9915 stop:10286 length:372 start_codon:yes stop_codon:yes gene_type:complete
MVCKWWEWWWKGEPGIEKDLLPSNENCLVLEYKNEPIYAGFLFMGKDAPMGYLTWIVSNPFYKVKNRKELLETFIKNVELKAKDQGASFMFTVCSNNTLIKAHKDLGWWVDDKQPSWEGFKYI